MSGQSWLVITVALYGSCRTLATGSASSVDPSRLSVRGLPCPPHAPQSTNDPKRRRDCVAAKRSLHHACVMHCRRQRILLGPCLILCLCFHAGASDWPQFLGPTRDAVYAASPLVTDKAVILPVGGTNAAGVVAFARATGEILWQALDEKAGASSPVLATFAGKPQVLVVTRAALHSLDPETGTNYWQVPTRRQTSGNVYAASPVVFGDQIFLSAWYQLGAQLLRVKHGQPEEIWRRDDAISTHYANGIVLEGHLYGFHGHAWERGGPSLRCIELATGKIVWEQPQAGSGTIIRAGGNLLILSDSGELQLAKASPSEFKIKARAQVVGRTTRSYAAIADGLVFVKGPRKLVCLDLRA